MVGKCNSSKNRCAAGGVDNSLTAYLKRKKKKKNLSGHYDGGYRVFYNY